MRTILRLWAARLRAMFTHSAADCDFDEELESHVEMLAADKIRAGLDTREAYRQARLEMGGISELRDAHREVRGLPFVETLILDLRFALRTMRREAAVTAFAILIIGLGVGASTTIFSVVSTLWLKPLPFPDADRLVWISNGPAENLSKQSVQVGHVLDLKEQSQSLESLAAFSPFYGVGDIRVVTASEHERATGVPVTQDFFAVLGVRPMMGRFFTSEECRQAAPQTVVLSYAFWARHLNARRDAVGSYITLNGAPAAVVGVLPREFDFAGTFSPGRPADLFLPFPLSPENNRKGNTLVLVGRVKSGVEWSAAAAEIRSTVERFIPQAPEVDPGRPRNTFRPLVSPLQRRITGRFYGMLAVVSAAVGFLMLLVSANVSSLLLARASARRKEMAVRMALGAGRGRLLRQVLVEGLALSCTGAALGLALAFGGTWLIANLHDVRIPLLHSIRVDGLVMAFTAVLAIVSGVGFGMIPALQSSGAAPRDALNESGRGVAGAGTMLRHVIVVGQIALVCVLLGGAGLLTRSLLRLLAVDPGFSPANVVTLRVDPLRQLHATRDARNAYFETILRHARSTPAVESAGLTDALPLGDNFGWRGWTVTAPDTPSMRANPLVRMIDDGYFSTMRITRIAGRDFSPLDTASSERVVIINQAFARALWQYNDPLGRLIRTSGQNYRVVGVVHDVRYFDLERDTGPEIYMLLRQTGDYATVDLVVRGSLPAASLIPGLQSALKSADPSLPAVEFRTMNQLLETSLSIRRLIVVLLAGFAVFALTLASLGIYAVISYAVIQRTREIGVRMVLGASPLTIQGGILAQTLILAAAGLTLGLPAAWMAAKSIGHLLYGIDASDAVTYIGVAAVVGLAAGLSGYLPSRKASRMDPLLALRPE